MSRITACRACGRSPLLPVLDLGQMPLANALLPMDHSGGAEPLYPLELVFCPACTLTQITETVPPEALFGEYVYFSSYSETMLEHAREEVTHLIERQKLDRNSLVIEVASNDGYLLQYFVERGIPVLGIEPAANVAAVAQKERKVPTLTAFFGAAVAGRIRQEGRLADVVIANNVLAHVSDLAGFVGSLRKVLKPSGVAVMEVPYVMDMIAKLEFDTIYHEHLCYFSVKSLEKLFRTQGMAIVDVEQFPIHGGSIRIYAVPFDGLVLPEPSDAARRLSRSESVLSTGGMPAALSQFSERVGKLRGEIGQRLRDIRTRRRRLAAYGAAAKGTVLMNACGIGSDVVEFVVDRNPVKVGKRMPGTHQPILHPLELVSRRPDYVLILPWNLSDEIIEQQSAYRAGGGRFIIPVPEFRMIE